MTGVFFQTLSTVKNFFTHSLSNRQERNLQDNSEPSQSGFNNQRHSRFNSFGLNSLNLNSGGRKRPAERLIEIELEITDDEDESPNNQTWSEYRKQANLPKRFKSHNQSQYSLQQAENMANRNAKYPTRGSGIPPEIEGLEKQPWEFKFKPTRSRAPTPAKTRNPDKNSVSSVEWSLGSLLKDTPSTSRNHQGNCTRQQNNHTSTSGGTGPSHLSNNKGTSTTTTTNNDQTDFRNFRFQQVQKGVDLITLDDDDEEVVQKPQNTRKSLGGPSPPRKSEEILTKTRKEPMKAAGRAKQCFNNLFSAIGRKSVDPISSSIRLEEKNLYRQLLQKTENGAKQLFPFTHKYLERSKVDKDYVKAVYHNWNNKSPSVSLRMGNFRNTPISSSTPKLSILDRVGNDLRLFSTPSASRSSGSTPPGPPTPILIDIEEEEKEKSQALVVVNGPSSSSNVDSFSVHSPSMHSSFLDLNHALSSSNMSVTDAEKLNYLENNESQEIQEIEKKTDDDDITILSESILNKGKRLNSLALEQNMSPYINPSWLNGLSTEWREQEKFRQKQIQENLETIDILKKESTLDKELRERMRKKLTLTEIIVLEEPVPELPEITEDMQIVINMAKRPGRDDDVLAHVFNIDFTRGDVKTLAPCKWLNDNVINLYMELIAQRSKEGQFPKAHVFTTFFYPKLLKEGYSNALKRWTRKVDIFANDLVIFPIHLGLHWCLACADFRNKTVKYYDSLGGRNDKCLNALLNYLAQEMKERKGIMLDRNEWELENVEDIPQQQNGSDCGVFSCKFAEYLSRDAKLTFEQENMNYYRDRMIYEIIKKDLLYP